MKSIIYPSELEQVFAQAVSVARYYYIDHKRYAELRLLDKATELYKANKREQ